ncbi:bifunctional (p)ppGpp synthetase/guanosine-3',5'-bis(diphosphate) 3'-pyrophosphohydrolase [Ruminiclostridium herbifermentans]|uniref:GTP diphosphokinase n=1 Tax=Ruminiclostridium herbifermentans TaxID=2488810 RepID=A0A4U7J9I9_9FIRM|nr:bifunctional (p)ppGpp synthetase/guanosine-3',5'-bis(diphosphate) 3'-pyrophosphohydrolase [Ruminiclostridium herbifermentans]QNU65577.1 bifunctional (p)ppGpp synthetase/guanosine-3',5'-bis(diphosphate) 3'-pyrophosphohydrolase [Ruminiclostridium herbifermentans]
MTERFLLLVEKVKKYDPNANFDLLEKAYNVSSKAHEGQQRNSGEPYIIHPVEVAIILADMELDVTALVAALLHDTIEDTTCTYEALKAEFGTAVAELVDGVTKLGKIPFTSKEEQQVENLRKMFVAMAKDIRVIMIKLADRLHNMRTLKYMTEGKQIEKARETLEIYAPLAHRLGISKIKWELEDLCLRYLDPKGYYDLVQKVAYKRKEREAYINEIVKTLKEKTAELGLENVQVDGRPKHFYSIYRKMVDQGKTIEQIYDLFAFRIIVNTVPDCYALLGLVHELYKPIPGRFKDFIAMPKPNMYQSLHTTLIGPEGKPFEVQIRTWEMHRVAEVGIAAHWKYKEVGKDGSGGKEVAAKDTENKFAWLRQLLEWQKDTKDENEFMETLKIDLFTDEVFIFTPKGDVLNLPVDSTPIDFAYYIHSAIGNKMIGAKVNGKMVPIDYKLQNGDIIEILTSSTIHGPSRDWLKIVKSSQARNKINQWFKKEKREENIIRGKEMIEKELKKQGFTYNQLFKPEWVELVLRRYNFSSLEDLYAGIGYGAMTTNKVLTKLKEEFKKTLKPEELEQILENIAQSKNEKKKKRIPESGIVVKGIDNCLVRLSRCCNPVPGDEIIGYITRGRGVSVHRSDCINVKAGLEQEGRLIDVKWYSTVDVAYKTDITVMAHDRSSLLLDVTNSVTELKIPIKALNARTTKEQVTIINLTLEISNTEQLEKIIKKIQKIDSVFDVTRNKQ